MPSNEELQAQVAALTAQVAALSKPTMPTPAQMVHRFRRSQRATPANPIVIQGQIDSITEVITSGVNSAGYGDKRTDFRSLDELRQIRNALEEDLADALGQGGRIRQIRMTTQADKGL